MARDIRDACASHSRPRIFQCLVDSRNAQKNHCALREKSLRTAEPSGSWNAGMCINFETIDVSVNFEHARAKYL
jgi:hypothetical protein